MLAYQEKHRQIIFVGHSLGGIVIKQVGVQIIRRLLGLTSF
jgi:predicted alpha/beta hydrolase family esterase